MKKARVILTNRWATFDCDPDYHLLLKDIFAYRKKNYEFRMGYREGWDDGLSTMFNNGRVATGLFLTFEKQVKEKFSLEISDQRTAPQFRKLKLDLRPYQLEIIEAMIASTGGLILAATGVGKTWTAGGYFKRLVGNGLFVVDELGLLEQTQRALEKFLGEEVGIVGRSEFSPKRITVATVQTLNRYRKDKEFRRWFKTIEAMVIDELHVQMGKRNFDVVSKIKPKVVFGLTATLELKYDYVRFPALALCGPLVAEYSIKEATNEGYLSKGVVGQVRFIDPLKGISPSYLTKIKKKLVRIPAGSPPADYRYHICLNAERNRRIEELVREGVRRKKRVAVLVQRKTHLASLSKRMEDIRHRAISGKDKGALRLQALKEMDAGKLPLILASSVFTKGVDVKSLNVIIDATGLPSRNNALQRYGRGTRTEEGKDGLIYFNIADEKSPFSGTARVRLRALKETGSPVFEVLPGTPASEIYDEAEDLLKS